MKMKRKIIALLLTACMILPIMTISGATGATAEDINAMIDANTEKAKQLEQEKIRLENQIADARSDMRDMNYIKTLIEQQMGVIQERMNVLADNIALQEQAIDDKQAEIDVLESRIELTEFEIQDRYIKIALLEAENEENKGKFAQIVKNDYMSGGYSFMNLLLSSGNFLDLILRAEAMKKATERHDEFMNDLLAAVNEQQTLIQELEDLKIRLADDIETCEREKLALEEQRDILQTNMDALNAEMDAERAKLHAHAGDIADLQDAINNMYRQYNATNDEIEAANAEVTRLIQLLQNLERPDYSGEGFMWPLDSRFRLITSDYGWCSWRGGPHHGFDVGNSGISGANIYAVQSGTVIRADWIGGYGNTVIIDHGGGVSTLYAHIQNGGLRVSTGDQVRQGDVIGLVGRTGWSTGDHLHFEVRLNGVHTNPWNYF